MELPRPVHLLELYLTFLNSDSHKGAFSDSQGHYQNLSNIALVLEPNVLDVSVGCNSLEYCVLELEFCHKRRFLEFKGQ